MYINIRFFWKPECAGRSSPAPLESFVAVGGAPGIIAAVLPCSYRQFFRPHLLGSEILVVIALVAI